MTPLVTGGAGFIASPFVCEQLGQSNVHVVRLDALASVGHHVNPAATVGGPHDHFVHGDILDSALVERPVAQNRPRAIVHFAADNHVDRSIHGPLDFVRTNVGGSLTLLVVARALGSGLPADRQVVYRFPLVGTCEVDRSLRSLDPPSTEDTPYWPNAHGAASKAAADHLVRAWHRTWGLPVTVSRGGDNEGPRHFTEKLIPPVVVRAACIALGHLRPDPARPCARLITHVSDRPGHDRRFAIDTTRARRELGWAPRNAFDSGLTDTWRRHQDTCSTAGPTALPRERRSLPHQCVRLRKVGQRTGDSKAAAPTSTAMQRAFGIVTPPWPDGVVDLLDAQGHRETDQDPVARRPGGRAAAPCRRSRPVRGKRMRPGIGACVPDRRPRHGD